MAAAKTTRARVLPASAEPVSFEDLRRPAPRGMWNLGGRFYPVPDLSDFPRVVFERVIHEHRLHPVEALVLAFIAYAHHDEYGQNRWGPHWPQVLEHQLNLLTPEVYAALESLRRRGLIVWDGQPYEHGDGWVTTELRIKYAPRPEQAT